MSDGHGEKRSRRAEAAITALLACPTLDAAAAASGVSVATLRRWLKQPKFAAAFRAAAGTVLQHSLARLQGALAIAVQALERNATCGDPDVEVRAATAITTSVLRAAELTDLAEKLAELEATLKGLTNDPA